MSVLKTNSIQPTTPGSEDYFLTRAWINFNGTGVVAIRGDGNVTSITDNGVGNYTINYTNTMLDANYAVIRSADYDSLNNTNAVNFTEVPLATTSSVNVTSGAASNAFYDVVRYEIAIFR